jgi:hypothetical protein
MSKNETLSRLGAILAEMYNAQYQGANMTHLYQTKGLADGYMRALCDLNIVADDELLEFVNEQKRNAAKRADRGLYRPARIEQAPDFA